MSENEMDNFYLRCPSNVSEGWMANEFTFELSHPIHFENPYQWECGLHEIFLPKRFYNFEEPFTNNVMRIERINVQRREDKVKALETEANNLSKQQGGLTQDQVDYYATEGKKLQQEDGEFMPESEMVFSLTPGYYTCEQLMATLNHQMHIKSEKYINYIQDRLDPLELQVERKAKHNRKLEYNKSKARFYLTLAKGDIVHFENKDFNSLVGLHTTNQEEYDYLELPYDKTNIFLKDNMPKTIKNTHYLANQRSVIHFPRTCDLDSESRHVYVYADVIQPTRVGNAYAPLLRIVNLSNDNNDDLSSFGVIHQEFRRPQYFPVIKQGTINKIEIALHNTLGKPFPFKGGASILDLHFRKIKKRLNPLK